MKQMTVTFTTKENAELVESEVAVLDANDVRGKTLFTLISPGTELASYRYGSKFPAAPGYAAVFKVDEIGSDVTGIEKDDVLFCQGGHRSIQQCRAANTVKLPSGLAPEKAVLARLAGVSFTTLMTTTARPGDLVIVSGAGPVGYLAAQIFCLSGYEVLIVEPDAKRREMVERASGIRTVGEISLEDKNVCGKAGLVIECSGHEMAVLAGCRAVRKRGEVVLVGVPWVRRTDITAHEVLHAIFHKYAVLRSGWEWELPMNSSDFRPHSIYSGYETAMRWISEDKIKAEGLSNLVSPLKPQKTYLDLMGGKCEGLFQLFDWRR